MKSGLRISAWLLAVLAITLFAFPACSGEPESAIVETGNPQQGATEEDASAPSSSIPGRDGVDYSRTDATAWVEALTNSGTAIDYMFEASDFEAQKAAGWTAVVGEVASAPQVGSVQLTLPGREPIDGGSGETVDTRVTIPNPRTTVVDIPLEQRDAPGDTLIVRVFLGVQPPEDAVRLVPPAGTKLLVVAPKIDDRLDVNLGTGLVVGLRDDSFVAGGVGVESRATVRGTTSFNSLVTATVR